MFALHQGQHVDKRDPDVPHEEGGLVAGHIPEGQGSDGHDPGQQRAREDRRAARKESEEATSVEVSKSKPLATPLDAFPLETPGKVPGVRRALLHRRIS
jgi:hypothetical protein